LDNDSFDSWFNLPASKASFRQEATDALADGSRSASHLRRAKAGI